MRVVHILKVFLFCLLIFLPQPSLYAQSKIAITIDDVPNTRLFQRDNYHSTLLDQLDSLNIPITIFVNEGLIYKTDSVTKNLELLEDWAKRDYITLGNHSYSHLRYSEVGFNLFEKDIEKGEQILRALAVKYEKPLKHFRFPYNDLGKDSLQHSKMDSTLQSRNYLSTPFTIESSDWMFNYVYEYYLSQDEPIKANEIGQLYLSATLDYIHFFDSLYIEEYGRRLNQIYLCHDNSLNAVYLSSIIEILSKENFRFISIDEAISDSAYQQEFYYPKKWGISWIYRWMTSPAERVNWMKQEPDISHVELLYKELSSLK